MKKVSVVQDLPSPGNLSGIYQENKGPTFGSRHVQILLLSFGYGVAFATRAVLSVAIVAMTDKTTTNPNVPVYDWTNKSVIISSILWSGIAVNLISGYLGKRYGPKWFMICACLLNSITFMMIPLAAKLGGSIGVICCRLVQGMCLGFIFPQQSVVLGRWVPPEERSRMGFVGVGVLIFINVTTNIAAGYISAASLGWPWIFYLMGILGIVWSGLYTFLGRQTPEEHPNIHPDERKYIVDSLKQTGDDQNSTPWKNIFSSKHFWAIVIGQIGQYYVIVMITSEVSIFLAKVMDYDIKSNGLLSSVPAAVGAFTGAFIAVISDMLVKHKVLAVVNARRLFQLTGVTGISLSLIAMTYIPVEHKEWSIVLLCFAQISIVCAATGGLGTNILDISPKYAGIITGCAQTMSQAVALFGPLIVQWVCTDESNASQWRIVFFISGGIAVSSGIFFAIFASGERQNWDGESEQEAEIAVKKRKSSVLSISAGIPA